MLDLKGTWGIPLVAYDGTTGGLLRDGRTLLLADANAGPYLRTQTSFMLVDVKKMRRLRAFSIKGDFSFDALSPDARYLYLTEHTTAQDLSRYRVRAYDLKAGQLLPKIVSDRRSWETTMQGSPISRLSTNGWAFTLYGGTVWVGGYELDLVVRRGRRLVFCEVKAKLGEQFGEPEEMVDGEKRRRLRRAAGAWLARHPEAGGLAISFDVIAIQGGRLRRL